MKKDQNYIKADNDLKKGRMFAAIANFVAAALFVIAYYFLDDILFLVAGAILVIAGLGIIVVFSIFRDKLYRSFHSEDPLEKENDE